MSSLEVERRLLIGFRVGKGMIPSVCQKTFESLFFVRKYVLHGMMSQGCSNLAAYTKNVRDENHVCLWLCAWGAQAEKKAYLSDAPRSRFSLLSLVIGVRGLVGKSEH